MMLDTLNTMVSLLNSLGNQCYGMMLAHWKDSWLPTRPRPLCSILLIRTLFQRLTQSNNPANHMYFWYSVDRILPESPRWLYSKDKHEKGEEVLKKMAKWNGTTLPDDLKIELVSTFSRKLVFAFLGFQPCYRILIERSQCLHCWHLVLYLLYGIFECWVSVTKHWKIFSMCYICAWLGWVKEQVLALGYMPLPTYAHQNHHRLLQLVSQSVDQLVNYSVSQSVSHSVR